MIKTVDQTTVADIFSINNDKIYRIPKYQREYIQGINAWDSVGLSEQFYSVLSELINLIYKVL